MAYTNSSLITSIVDLFKNSNPRKNATYNPTGAITKITIHHMAGVMGSKECAQMHARGNGASANYYVGPKGGICLGVDESRRAWTTGSKENDYRAITIEVSNDGGENTGWHVSDVSIDATVALCIDICKRNNIERIEYTGDKSGNLTMHKWYQKTTCPGPYLESKFPEIAKRINDGLSTSAATQEPKTLYCVQVGAFAVKSNADKLMKELTEKGYKPFIWEKKQ